MKGKPFYVSYLTPIMLTIGTNLVVLALVLRALFKKASVTKDKYMDVSTKARIVAACSVLMGVTWIVGLFAVDELTLTFQIIFCIFNSLQGFFIFVFYCAQNKEVQREWKKCFGCDTQIQSRGYSASEASHMSRGSLPKRRSTLTEDSFTIASISRSEQMTSIYSSSKSNIMDSPQSDQSSQKTLPVVQ